MLSRLLILLAFALTAAFQPVAAFAMNRECMTSMISGSMNKRPNMDSCDRPCRSGTNAQHDTCAKLCATPCVGAQAVLPWVVATRMGTPMSSMGYLTNQDRLVSRAPPGIDHPPKQ